MMLVVVVVVADDYSENKMDDENDRNSDSVWSVEVDHFEMVMIEKEDQHSTNRRLVQLDHLHYVEMLGLYPQQNSDFELDKLIIYIQHNHFRSDDEQQSYHVDDISIGYVEYSNLVYLQIKLKIIDRKTKDNRIYQRYVQHNYHE